MGSEDATLRCDGCGHPFDVNIPALCHGGKAHGFTIRPVEVTMFSPSVSPTDARLAALTAERDRWESEAKRALNLVTEIVGIVQRLQPKGSPIPGDSVTLVSWIVDTVFRERDELLALLSRAGAVLAYYSTYRPLVDDIKRALDGAKGGECGNASQP